MRRAVCFPNLRFMLKYETMNIAIDLTQIPADKTGVGIYALNLIREMLNINNTSRKFHFILFTQDDDNTLLNLVKKNNNTTLIPVKHTLFRKLLPRLFFEQVLLPRKCRKLKADLIFSTHYTIPYFTRIKRVVAFHDTTFYRFPELHRKIKRLYFKALIPLSIKKSSAIISVSQSTRNDLIDRFKRLDPNKITVIHHGTDFFYGDGNEKEQFCRKILGKYGLNANEYFLFVGTLEPRKNITGLLEAFHLLRQTDKAVEEKYKLVIVGKKGWFYNKIFETTQKLELENAVIFTGYVEEEEKQALLLNASLFIYPSFYEGFGIPILEAMAGGTPVITSGVSALPEVAGDAAVFIDPQNWEEISTAMASLLGDRTLYEDLTKKGLAQAKKFSWQSTAANCLEVHTLQSAT